MLNAPSHGRVVVDIVVSLALIAGVGMATYTIQHIQPSPSHIVVSR